MNRIEKKIKRILARSDYTNMKSPTSKGHPEAGERLVDKRFGGETILVIGRFFKDILRDFHGNDLDRSFCLPPTRIIESILRPESRSAEAPHAAQGQPSCVRLGNLPFLIHRKRW